MPAARSRPCSCHRCRCRCRRIARPGAAAIAVLCGASRPVLAGGAGSVWVEDAGVAGVQRVHWVPGSGCGHAAAQHTVSKPLLVSPAQRNTHAEKACAQHVAASAQRYPCSNSRALAERKISPLPRHRRFHAFRPVARRKFPHGQSARVSLRHGHLVPQPAERCLGVQVDPGRNNGHRSAPGAHGAGAGAGLLSAAMRAWRDAHNYLLSLRGGAVL